MVDTSKMQMQKIPENSLSGNMAFDAFTHALRNISKLQFHVELNMGLRRSERTKFFVERIAGQLGALQDRSPCLSSVDVKINMSFWEDRYLRVYPPSVLPVAHEFMTCAGMDRSTSTFAEAAASEAGKILLPLSQALQGLSTAKSRFLGHDDTSKTVCSQHVTKISLRWDDAELLWSANTSIIQRYRRRTVTLEWGTFDLFCTKLQDHLYGTVSKAANSMVLEEPYTCQIGLPCPGGEVDARGY
jgi:hypothetical protein